jgi:hypothetical protein
MYMNPPTIAAIIAEAARTIRTICNRLRALYAPFTVLVIVVFALPVTAGMELATLLTMSAATMIRMAATTTANIAAITCSKPFLLEQSFRAYAVIGFCILIKKLLFEKSI